MSCGDISFEFETNDAFAFFLQERQVKEILIPTIESHLEQWRGDAPGDKENASDDRIP